MPLGASGEPLPPRLHKAVHTLDFPHGRPTDVMPNDDPEAAFKRFEAS